MTTKLGTLTVDLLAKTGSFETDIKRAERTTESAMGGIASSATAAGAVLGTALVAGAGAAAFALKGAIDRADELSKSASKIGVDIEALSGLTFAAELADVSFQQLEGGITRLIRSQESAASGQGQMASLFDTLGIKATDASGKLRAADEVLLDLADVFESLPDGAEKTALAVDLFGRSGAELIPLLNEGSIGIGEMTDEAARLGLVLDTETGKAAEDFNDDLTRLRSTWDGFTNQLLTAALPTLQATATALKDVATAAATTFKKEGLFADDFFSSDSGLIAQLYRDRGFEAPGLISDGTGPTLTAVLGGAGTKPDPPAAPSGPKVEFITPETLAAKALEEALRKRREEQEKAAAAAEAAAEADRLFAQAQREAAQAAAELDRAVAERDQAAAEFQVTLEDYRAEVEGPLAQAELEWERRQQQLNDLAARGEISQTQLKEALGFTAELRRRDVEAIEAQLTPYEQLIADLEAERALLGMSNTEREIANALKYAGVDAASAEGQAIADSIRQIEEARERIQFSDDIRRGFEDTFASIIDGSKSAKDALEDLGSYVTQLIAQRLSEQLVDSLFGKPGTPLGGGGGGGIGNLFSSAISALFGGGRAAGGWVSPGKMYEVAENGPELLRVGNRQFLLPTATGGMVTPNARLGGGGGVVQNITVQGRVDSRTAAQLARETQRAQSRASARFGA